MKFLTSLAIVSMFLLTGCAHNKGEDCSSDKRHGESKSCDLKKKKSCKDKKDKSCKLKKKVKKKSCCM